MIVEFRIYSVENGEWKNVMKSTQVWNNHKMVKGLMKWYKNHPYAKMLDDEWICGDYRIDQQRPQRNVMSDGYIKIVSITKMEKYKLKNWIKILENEIDYPTVWDDGENRYYEETIYCPKCGKRRKVLTSKTHCEFCGFEFSKALKCHECGTLNLKGSEKCKKCGYEFRKKSFINNNNFEVNKNNYHKKNIICPICNTRKSEYFDKCKCGFDFSKHKQCKVCNEWVNIDDNYCGNCGNKFIKMIICKKCGKRNDMKNNYCNYCGNKLK